MGLLFLFTMWSKRKGYVSYFHEYGRKTILKTLGHDEKMTTNKILVCRRDVIRKNLIASKYISDYFCNWKRQRRKSRKVVELQHQRD